MNARSRITFATTNATKLEEARLIFPHIDPLQVDLPEVQSANAHEVVKAKLDAIGRRRISGAVLVEDTALHVERWGGMPGPFIKWFVAAAGPAAFAQTVLAGDDYADAVATSAVGVVYGSESAIWCGHTQGRVVNASGEGAGWNAIFTAPPFDHTFAELAVHERASVSMRRTPLLAAHDWLAARELAVRIQCKAIGSVVSPRQMTA